MHDTELKIVRERREVAVEQVIGAPAFTGPEQRIHLTLTADLNAC